MAKATTTRNHHSSALLDHLGRLSRARNEASLGSLGLRPRHFVTLTVLRDQGAMAQQALAERLHVDRTNLVGLLNALEENGLVARTRSAEDRRRHLVELTEAGTEKLLEAERAIADAEDEVLGGLDADEREQLYQLLQRATTGATIDCSAAVEPDAAC